MTFRKEDRDAAAIYQDVPPDAKMDADHIHPKSKGGSDDVANLEFMNPADNRAKSDHVMDMRGWQEDFIQDWDRSTRDSFLLVAIPGSGKTRAALWASRRFLQAGHDRRLIIAVPTLNVRKQWADEAQHQFGIRLQTKEFGTNFKSGFVGGVCTYAYLSRSAPLIRKICATAPTLVILDEPHHLAEEAVWGDSARHAFELSKRRLLLSGTPFRTDGWPIPWVRYGGDGYSIADFRYDYPDAIREAIVRNLVFDYSQGKFAELFLGNHRTLDFHGELSENDAADRLRPILQPGEYVAQMLRLAHTKLQDVRKAIPDAGAMAVCMDITHAQLIAKVIREVTGCQPSIVVSDEETATDTIDLYRESHHKQWVVSVRQIIEGTDIKRLHVLVWLTNATTEMTFRQLIGRVSRVRFQDPKSPPVSDEALAADLEAYVFLPADPRLIAHAKNIEDAQGRALKGTDEDSRPPRTQSSTSSSTRIFLGSEHTGLDTLIIGNHAYSAAQAGEIEAMVKAGGIKTEAAAKLFDFGFRLEGSQRNPDAPHTVPQKTDEERCDELRRECGKKAYRLAKMLDVDVKEIHLRWPAQKTMGLQALQDKLNTLLREIATTEEPWH